MSAHTVKYFWGAITLGQVAAVFLLCTSAMAQTQGKAGFTDAGKLAPRLEEVVITAPSPGAPTERSDTYTLQQSRTATRLDLSPRATPQTINVLTRRQMEDFQLNNINDALQAGGIGVQRVETDRTYFTSRGLDVNNFQVDGIGLPFSSEEQMGDIDTFLYDRIEILKGANGLTSNPGTPSATINFVRKRPTRAAQAAATLRYGSWATRRAEIDVSGSLNESGSLRGRVLAAGQQGNSYLDRYSLGKSVFSGMLEADLTEHSTLLLGHSQQRNRAKGIMWSALALYDRNGSPISYDRSYNTAPDWAYWDTTDQQSFSELRTDWGGGWSSQLTASYRQMTSDAEMMLIGQRGEAPDPLTGLGLSTYGSKFDRKERQVFGDAFIKGPFMLGGRHHEVVLGANWARTNARWTSSDDAIALPAPPVGRFDGNFERPAFASVTSRADYTILRRSLYAAGHFSLTDPLKLTTGVSLTNLSSNGQRLDSAHAYDKTKATPYLGLVYDLGRHYSVYGSYTRIFNPQYLLDQSQALLDPIEGNNLEAGVKGEWYEGRVNASLAVFRTRQQNTAEYAGWDAVKGFGYYRPVDTTVQGYDLTLAGRLAPGWELSAGMTHLFSMRDGDGQTTRTFTPKNTFYLATSYRLPQLPDLKIGTSVQWQGDIYRNQGTTANGRPIISRQAAYAVVNAMLSYSIDKSLTASLNINNLFDRKYLTSLYWEQAYYAPGRNITAGLTWRY